MNYHCAKFYTNISTIMDTSNIFPFVERISMLCRVEFGKPQTYWIRTKRYHSSIKKKYAIIIHILNYTLYNKRGDLDLGDFLHKIFTFLPPNSKFWAFLAWHDSLYR